MNVTAFLSPKTSLRASALRRNPAITKSCETPNRERQPRAVLLQSIETVSTADKHIMASLTKGENRQTKFSVSVCVRPFSRNMLSRRMSPESASYLAAAQGRNGQGEGQCVLRDREQVYIAKVAPGGTPSNHPCSVADAQEWRDLSTHLRAFGTARVQAVVDSVSSDARC